MLASTSMHVVEQAPQNGCHQCEGSPGELQLPPASLGHSPRSAGGSDPGFFQIISSSLVLECMRLCVQPLRVDFPQLSVSP